MDIDRWRDPALTPRCEAENRAGDPCNEADAVSCEFCGAVRCDDHMRGHSPDCDRRADADDAGNRKRWAMKEEF